ncbi:MAG: XRE family transcriptional regulator [Acidobacteriota bacterium]
MLMIDILTALKANLNSRIRNGELTERNLAKRIGLSQAHMHNVLKGARILTAEVADLLMLELNLTVSDLFTEEGMMAKRRPPGTEHRLTVVAQVERVAGRLATSR